MKTTPVRRIMHFILAFLLMTNPLLGAFYPLVRLSTPAVVEAASQQPTALARTVPAADNTVSITDSALMPDVITITVGSSVTWVNNGTVPHQVISGTPPPSTPTATATATASETPTATATPTNTPSPTTTATPTEGDYSLYLPLVLDQLGAFVRTGDQPTAASVGSDWDSGVLQPGGVFSHTFTITGTHSYYNPLHPELTGQVVVEEAEVVANQTPVVTIISPAEGAVLATGDNIEVTGTVTDDGTVVSVLVNEVSATLVGDNFSATISLGAGNQVIDVEASDDQGAMGLASRVLSIDHDGPQITISAPEDRQSVYTLTPTLAISYTDFQASVDTTSLNVTVSDENGTQSSVTGLTATGEGASGTMTLPADDSTYTVTVSVADTFGNRSTSQATFYVPPDPSTITPPEEAENAGWISGYIYDSSTCDEHQTNCQGLAGVQVNMSNVDTEALARVRAARKHEIETRWLRNRSQFVPLEPLQETSFTSPISGTIVTGPDGFFAFPIAETGSYWLRADKDGYTYGQREAEVVLERSTATNAIYLTPLDSAMTPCDNDGCLHNSSDGMLQLDIPAGAIPAGETLDVTATNFEQVEFLPSGDLPPETWETYAFNLGGDSEFQFRRGTQATVRISNTVGFDPGTQIPLGYWNQATQAWEHSGTGVVDATGEWVEMTVTHFSNYDCNDPIAQPELDEDLDTETEEDDPCGAAGEEGCFINAKSGTLQEWVDLPATNVMGESVAPQLRYSTERANPSEVIDVKLNIEQIGSEIGDHIGWELYIEGEKTDSFTFSANLDESGEVGRFRYLWDGRNAQGELLPPGVYEYEVKLTIPYLGQYCYALNGIFGNPPDCENGATGRFVDATEEVWARGTVELNTQPDSPFGAGWVLNGQQQLYEDQAGRIVVANGDQTDEFYFPWKDLLAADDANALAAASLSSTEPSQETVDSSQMAEETALHNTDEPLEVPSATITDTVDVVPAPSWTMSDTIGSVVPQPKPPAITYTLPTPDFPTPEAPPAPSWTDEEAHETPTPDAEARKPYTERRVGIQTDVCGEITSDTTWTLANSPYQATCDVTISDSVTLTVEPGVEVQFANGYTGLFVDGSLVANGSESQPITLTKSSNAHWEGIYVRSSGAVELDHVTIEYAGHTGYSGNIGRALRIASSDVQVSNSTIRHSHTSSLSSIYIENVGLRPQFSNLTLVGNGSDRIDITGGTLEGDWTLDYVGTQDVPYRFLSDLVISNTHTLTITAGIQLQFPNGYTGLFVDGSLVANGTESQPITLTKGSNAHWEGIYVRSSGAVELDHVTIEYAGHTGYSGNIGRALRIASSDVQVSNSTIRHSHSSSLSSIYIENVGLRPQFSNLTLVGNGSDRIDIPGGIVEQDWTLDYVGTQDVPYRFSSDLVISNTHTLTIAAGIELQFPNGYTGLFVHGSLVANGTDSQPITLTKGSNAHWEGIYVRSSGAVELDHVTIEYAGHTGYSGNIGRALRIASSDVQVSNSTIRNAYSTAIHIEDGASPTFVRNQIFSNTTGIYIEDGQPIFDRNWIEGNSSYGVRNVSGVSVEAGQNYWGDASGPYHPTLNPNGQGDRVSDDVEFEPWLEEPVFDLRTGFNRTGTDYSTLGYDPATKTYSRIYPNGIQVHFNLDGTHDYTLEPDGRKMVYSYNADRSVATMGIIAPGESTPRWTWTFNYSMGKLTGISDPAGRVTSFTVDSQGNLVEAITPDSATQRFAYDAEHLLTHYTDQNDAVTTYSYDSYGRIATVTEPARAVYDPETGQTEVMQEVRTFTPSDTSYPLINNSPVGDPNNPAPAVPTSADLADRIDYGRGSRSGHTNKWGSWLDMTDGEGRTTFYQRDNANNVIGMKTPDGDCAEYSYDNMGNRLSEMRMSAAQCGLARAARDATQVQQWRFTYEEQFNQIKSATDPLSNTTTYLYDYEDAPAVGEAGKLIRIIYPAVEDENGQVVTPTVSYTYNALGLLESETDARGTVTKYIYTQGTSDEASDGANPLFAAGVTPVPGLLTQVIADFGDASQLNLTTTYREFDAAGNPQSVIGPDGHNATAFTYDAMNRVLSQTDAVGIITTLEYDGRGNLTRRVVDDTADGTTGRNVVTEYSYDPNDQLLNEHTAADGLVVQTSNSYDINRQLAVQQDGRGNQTTYLYDDADQLVNMIDPAGHVITLTYTLEGQVERITDPEGHITRFVYDEFNRLASVIGDEGELNLTTSYTYDLNDNLLTRTDADGAVTRYEYDALNRRTVEIQDHGGLNLESTYRYDLSSNLLYTTDPRGVVTYAEYDALNRITLNRLDDGGLNLETTYSYDSAGNLAQTSDERGIITSLTYDVLNRLTQRCQDAQALNLCSNYTYDRLNQQQTVTNPDSVTTRTEYNAFGMPLRVIEDMGGFNATTSFSYDNALNLTGLTDANGNATLYDYTPRNQLGSQTYADGTVVGYTYDARGNIKTGTDQDNQTTTYSYDGASRLTSKSFSTGGSQSFAYDPVGRLTSSQESMNAHNSLLAYSYNALGDVISTTQSLDAMSWQVAYSYHYVSGTYTVTYPSGVQRMQELDSINRLDAVRQGDNSLIADYDYRDLESYKTVAYANSVSTRTDYDALYRTTRVSSTVADYRYGYDAASNRTYMQRAHQPGQPADVYQYDNLYQLTQVWYNADATTPGSITSQELLQQYQLDKVGNRLAVQNDAASTTYQPNNGQQLTNPMNRYQQVAGASFNYDQRGNMLSDGTNSYTYDILDRQLSMNRSGSSAQYIYDAFGRRIAKTVGNDTTYYIYDTNYRVIEERASDNSLSARYTYGAGVDEPLTMERGGNTYYYHRDALGSVTEVTDSAGSLIERYQYDVYGQPYIFDGADNPLAASAIGNPYLFTARRYDTESGNYYYRARYYNPAIGRFVSQDPIGYEAGDANLYRYVGNNPLNFTDPRGMEASEREPLTVEEQTPEYFKTYQKIFGYVKKVVKRAENTVKIGIPLAELTNHPNAAETLRTVQPKVELLSAGTKGLQVVIEIVDYYYYDKEVEAKKEAGIYGSGETAEFLEDQMKTLGLIESGMSLLSILPIPGISLACVGCTKVGQDRGITKLAELSYVKQTAILSEIERGINCDTFIFQDLNPLLLYGLE